jgi:hypothetical protein
MNQAHEVAEKIEHAAHGHGGGVSRLAGITMAILGVMLALCAALVGGARTELIATMVEQSNTFQKYQAQRMKHRVMVTQLATLHALSPSHRDLLVFEHRLADIHPSSGRPDGEDVAEMKASLDLVTKSLVQILEPRAADQSRLLAMAKRYVEETEAASRWAESYQPAVEAHSAAAEHFELGQLAAEIGIVIASVALLLGSRPAWYVSLVFGAACAIMLTSTFVTTRAKVRHAEEETASTKTAYQALRKASGEDDEREILEEVEKRIREMQGPAEPADHAAP